MNTEPVLLIYDNQRQLIEDNLILEDSMSTDHHMGIATFYVS